MKGSHRLSVLSVIVLVVVISFLPHPKVLSAGQAASRPSAFCHATDGSFTVCPDGGREWSDVPFVAFPEAKSFLYADQADLDPNRAQQRAWVVPDVRGKYSLPVSGDMTVPIEGRNFGHTPAVNVILSYDLRAHPIAFGKVGLNHLTRPQVLAWPGVIAPNAAVFATAKTKLSPADMTAIQQRTASLVVWGTLAYTDQYQSEGQGRFCRLWYPEAEQFMFCPGIPDDAK